MEEKKKSSCSPDFSVASMGTLQAPDDSHRVAIVREWVEGGGRASGNRGAILWRRVLSLCEGLGLLVVA